MFLHHHCSLAPPAYNHMARDQIALRLLSPFNSNPTRNPSALLERLRIQRPPGICQTFIPTRLARSAWDIPPSAKRRRTWRSCLASWKFCHHPLSSKQESLLVVLSCACLSRLVVASTILSQSFQNVLLLPSLTGSPHHCTPCLPRECPSTLVASGESLS